MKPKWVETAREYVFGREVRDVVRDIGRGGQQWREWFGEDKIADKEEPKLFLGFHLS